MSATAHLPRRQPPLTFQGRALVAGRQVNLLQALDEAAAILDTARLPLLLLACDMAAANAALDLGEQTGAAVDVHASEALAREAGAYHAGRVYTVTHREAYARADVVLVTGEAAARALGTLAEPEIPLRPGPRRKVLHLRDLPGPYPAADAATRLSVLAALLRPDPAPIHESAAFADARAFVGELRAAKYGVAIWSPADLDMPGIALVANLVNLLNGQTRFSAMPVRTAGNAWGIAQLMLARWGVPPRARFAAGRAEHDPWRFAGPRLIQAGEADAVLSIASLAGPPLSGFGPRAISIAAEIEGGANVEIQAGVPGLDHDGEWFDAGADAVVSRQAAASSSRPRAAGLVRDIAMRLVGGTP